MSRYIDADELYKATQKRIAEANEARMAVVDDEFLDLIDDAFTEDVVPRAEVVNKICYEIEEEIVAALESNYRALKEWDDGRCNDYILEMVNRIKGKIDALRGIEGFVEELKKKYTDAETEPPKGE